MAPIYFQLKYTGLMRRVTLRLCQIGGSYPPSLTPSRKRFLPNLRSSRYVGSILQDIQSVLLGVW